MKEVRPRVSVLVVSYNTRDMTLECLRSVTAETTEAFEIIVVDNCSDDGSAEAISEHFPDVKLLAEKQNHGFAKGNNIAASKARGDYLLLLNPDTIVLDAAIDNLVNYADRHPEARIWGGRTLFADGSLNPTSCWREISLWTIFCRTSGLTGVFPESDLFNPEAYGGWMRDTERQVEIVSGCFFLIRRDDWNALGGFDLTFFMYAEEADLCMRARRTLGATPRITPEATIVHYGGASETVRADRVVRVLRAKSELMKRHFPYLKRNLAIWLHKVFPLTRYLVGRLQVRGIRGEAADVWKEVWQRRGEWSNGFTEHSR
ncbi:glycosyltransferase family 2 protein [Maritimibacter dapengensis]